MTEGSKQAALFAEDILDALRDVVRALGGPKDAGLMLRPELSADDAGKWVKDCLNPDRRERFDPAQTLFLLRKGREVGCHSAMWYIAEEAGYARPVPLEPLDEAGELQRQIAAAAKVLDQATRRLERLQITVRAVA